VGFRHWAKGLKIGYTKKEWLFLTALHTLRKFLENRVKNRLSWVKKSTFVARKPTFVAKNQTFVGRKPTFVARKPTFVAKNQTFVGRKPTFVGRKLGHFYMAGLNVGIVF
jgi:hypothetical protein